MSARACPSSLGGSRPVSRKCPPSCTQALGIVAQPHLRLGTPWIPLVTVSPTFASRLALDPCHARPTPRHRAAGQCRRGCWCAAVRPAAAREAVPADTPSPARPPTLGQPLGQPLGQRRGAAPSGSVLARARPASCVSSVDRLLDARHLRNFPSPDLRSYGSGGMDDTARDFSADVGNRSPNFVASRAGADPMSVHWVTCSTRSRSTYDAASQAGLARCASWSRLTAFPTDASEMKSAHSGRPAAAQVRWEAQIGER